ncbi:MAG: tRNA 2-thiouridine(34) synthase MnmA [Bacillota bacterium]|jgi:tRNA-specific 2-thiouridylase|nr:tRNA 2-thiouridine(34) synthase MnmA [Bacillota bacterium]NLL26917.1 tRNA 2-thiouridine(34) synthase MnmA [Erysipelotrichia bacterium]
MKKVLVGLSGGVDSAVCAYLLIKQGYDVTGAFMRNWDSAVNNDILGNPTILDDVCPQERDYQDALAVADSLGIELLRVDFVKEYWNDVFSNFISEHQKGRTPNPDILCNKYIKFDAFYSFAKSKGFEIVATGHYARIIKDKDSCLLLKGIDNNKDQSYFLAQIDRGVLKNTLFPLGELDKSEVREIALEMDLPVAEKKDSTGICFIGERNFKEFLRNYLPSKEGDIVDVLTKEVVGKHIGVMYYTIGQRKGLGIGGGRGRWFVVGKNVEANELYVAAQDEDIWLYSDSCLVSGFNRLADFEMPKQCNAKFRYRQNDSPVTIEQYSDDLVLVKYPQKIKAVTPGQQAVFYDGDICLGGGVIEKTFIGEIEHSKHVYEHIHG